jgi:hypothetical protein
MYRTRSIHRKSGYYRIYDETTKPAPEASVLNVQPLNGWMERRGSAVRAEIALCSRSATENISVGDGDPPMPVIPNRQG